MTSNYIKQKLAFEMKEKLCNEVEAQLKEILTKPKTD